MTRTILLWLAVAALMVAVGVSSYSESATPPPPPPAYEAAPPLSEAAAPPPPPSLLTGDVEVDGVGELNGTSSNPPTMCGSVTALNATGCGYMTPTIHGDLTVANANITGNFTTPADPINLP
ncbi:hypothetical protein RND81_14G051900 [Saponaria officinalis]|uniref:Uncharacterized protein n=1 Tax=Saponaria officinalis TaxID=3572 RepID=A0AAW1GHW5_SAPOF